MRLDYVEVCGFRGFREKVRIDFGTGFTVLSGRNGVGKSSLCDAVEFAITGRIDKYRVETAAKERLEDYLWWRGEGAAAAHYVTLAFTRDNGEPFVITRRRGSGSDTPDDEIESALCSGPAPEDALTQLCKTSIIRDEWIAALSLDLSETQRFELVRSALGAIEGAEVGEKADEVLKSAKATHDKAELDYEGARAHLNQTLAQLSQAQDAAGRTGDLSAALQLLSDITADAPQDLIGRLTAGRRALVDRRARLGPITEAAQRGRDLAAARQEFDAPERAAQRGDLLEKLAAAREAREAAEALLSGARATLEREEAADAMAASLTLLVEHGERLGLHDDRCPLCAAARTQAEFAAGLAVARSRVANLASGVSDARQALKDAEEKAQAARDRFYVLDQEAAGAEREEQELVAAEAAHAENLTRLGLWPQFAAPDELELEVAAERGRLIDLERALLTLEASQAVARVSALEAQVARLREEVDQAATLMSQAQAALSSAREIERAVKRVGAEIIDERLAQISPLLNELYQRLRPHSAWRTIDYSIRGDVRRFLSLKVGDNLNPQFVFSSGQRRAAGLAFLLSVHLSRSWTPWQTLVLDDPVQHIDDFRALQLVEVLAAFRLDNRQIVCAVEDEDLADLLCRRLISTPEASGRRYDIGMDTVGAAAIVSETEIPPLPPDVLRKGSGLQAVG